MISEPGLRELLTFRAIGISETLDTKCGLSLDRFPAPN